MSILVFQYLQTLHLQSSDLLDVFGGISFFPLDKMTYLKIQSFVNRVEESLSLIKYTAFLYNDQLIWYRLNTICLHNLCVFVPEQLKLLCDTIFSFCKQPHIFCIWQIILKWKLSYLLLWLGMQEWTGTRWHEDLVQILDHITVSQTHWTRGEEALI